MKNYKVIVIAVVLMLVAILLAVYVQTAEAGTEDKVTICHASGLQGTLKYETLTLAWQAVFGQSGHFYEDGTPRAGHENDYLGQCIPTAVDLVSFTAEKQGNKVLISWETATEKDNLGFNLYRSWTKDSYKYKVNKSLIISTVPPGSPFGSSYTFYDNRKVIRYYWLEAIDISGESEWYMTTEKGVLKKMEIGQN